jgi:hypothetical protein
MTDFSWEKGVNVPALRAGRIGVVLTGELGPAPVLGELELGSHLDAVLGDAGE